MDKDVALAREQVEGFSLFKKIGYYWDYYKFRFIFAMIMVVLIGFTVYTKMTEPEYDVDVSVFAYEFMNEQDKGLIERNLTALLTESYGDKKSHPVGVDTTGMVKRNGLNEEAVLASETKITAILASGKSVAFILDEQIYNEKFIVGDYGYLEDKEFSGEIGPKVKKILGLDANKKYYYITARTKSVVNGLGTAVRAYENSKKLYLKIKEVN